MRTTLTRLETLLPDIAETLRRASPVKQREAGAAASGFAIASAKVDHPLVKTKLEKVRSGGVLSSDETAELDALSARLDEEYFELQEAADKGRGCADAYRQRFGQARAVAALSFAGQEDAFHAATEAIYEAAASTDDTKELRTLIQSVLE